MKKMKRKVIKLKESDLEKLVNKILKEDMGGMEDTHPTLGNLNLSRILYCLYNYIRLLKYYIDLHL